jgi:two-component system, OmpR family, alkaline phosphatase synthesis response regulator PhoP
VPERILLVEDEEALRMTLGDRLRKEGYVVDCAADGDEGFARTAAGPYDLVILDVMLPRRDGLKVCRDIRAAGLITPVLMLTARGRTSDKVDGLKIGADDYVTKPFKMAELLARVEALLRRAPVRPAPPMPVHTFGDIRVDVRGTEVTRGGVPVGLSAREFQLLRFFLEHPNITLSRQDLLTRLWGYSASAFTRTVDVHVAALRQKLEDDPKQPRFLVTVQGLGYKFRS